MLNDVGPSAVSSRKVSGTDSSARVWRRFALQAVGDQIHYSTSGAFASLFASARDPERWDITRLVSESACRSSCEP